MKYLNQIKLFFRRIFATQPTSFLTWTVSDFELGKKWAKSLPHPCDPTKNLWDSIYNPQLEATEILHQLNLEINDRIKI